MTKSEWSLWYFDSLQVKLVAKNTKWLNYRSDCVISNNLKKGMI